jgi:ribosomal protein S21
MPRHLSVKVWNGDFEQAMRIFKKKVTETSTIRILKLKRSAETKGEKRRRKIKSAITRRKRAERQKQDRIMARTHRWNR